MANTTASASGTNRYRATPVRRNMGTKTMQMESVATKAGAAISRGAVEDGVFDLLAHVNVAVHVLDFHGGVIDENPDGQRQAP